MSSVIGVVLAGEPDLTFWPKARLRKPGFLMSVPGGDALLVRQWSALGRVCSAGRRYIVTPDLHTESISSMLTDAGGAVIPEPCNRGALGSLGLAMCHVATRSEDDVVVAMPWGLYITDPEGFASALSEAIAMARSRPSFVTLAARPTYPEPDSYYIRVGAAVHSTGRFAEGFMSQPGRAAAVRAMASEAEEWCSGALVFRASTWWKYLRRKSAEVSRAFQAIRLSVGTGFYKRVVQAEFAALESADLWETVFRDCATRSSRALATVESSGTWVLLTSWRALGQTGGQDASGNLASGPVLTVDCAECTLDTTRSLLVAVGLQNVAVIATDDVVLVCDRDRQSDVRSALGLLRANGMQRYL